MKGLINKKPGFPLKVAISFVIAVGITVVGVMQFRKNRTSQLDNIILISIDTIRADHLSCFGYQHKTTPNIDAFAETSILFEHCFSSIPLTLPSHATMLTGLMRSGKSKRHPKKSTVISLS